MEFEAGDEGRTACMANSTCTTYSVYKKDEKHGVLQAR